MEFKQKRLDIFANMNTESLINLFIKLDIKDRFSDDEFRDLFKNIDNLENERLVPVHIWFMEPTTSVNPVIWDYTNNKLTYDKCHYNYTLCPKKLIVMMKNKDFEKHKKNISTKLTRTSKYRFDEIDHADTYYYSNKDIGSYESNNKFLVNIYRIEKIN
jgi:hypothetical protein